MFKFILPKIQFNIEKWKWNKEYRVYVSNTGSFKDEYKNIIPIKINSNGYIGIKTYCGFQLAHRIVMKTWCPTIDMENLTVDHLDHNKRNNAVKNLEWVTKEENMRRAVEDLQNEPRKKSSKPVIYGIKAGKEKFSNVDEAMEFIKKLPGYGKNNNEETIKKNLEKAIEGNKLYFGRKWKKVVI